MIWLSVALLTSMVLVARAALSVDSRWRRLGAVAAAFIQFTPLLLLFLPAAGSGWGTGRGPFLLFFASSLLPGLYLLSWSVFTRDPTWQRVVSALAGLLGLAPVVFLLAVAAALR